VNRLLTPIQHLMPVIVERADWPVWLDEADGDPRASAR
jgi:putative SOS response-associated peptidase YedK